MVLITIIRILIPHWGNSWLSSHVLQPAALKKGPNMWFFWGSNPRPSAYKAHVGSGVTDVGIGVITHSTNKKSGVILSHSHFCRLCGNIFELYLNVSLFSLSLLFFWEFMALYGFIPVKYCNDWLFTSNITTTINIPVKSNFNTFFF